MFEKIREGIKRVMERLIGSGTVEQALGIRSALPPEMETASAFWWDVYRNRAPWLNQDIHSLGLASAICSKVARVATVEKKISVSGSARADYLGAQLAPFTAKLRENLEYALAQGGVMFKPYVSGEDVLIESVCPDSFIPTEINGRGEITGCVFIDSITRGDVIYTRLEYHRFESGRYIITNTAYRSRYSGDLGVSIPLSSLPEWAGLSESVCFNGVDVPLFSYFKAPHANTTVPNSRVGEAIFARAAGLIREADEHWSLYAWEFESAKRRLFVDKTAFDPVTGSTDKMYVGLDFGDADCAYHEFSPDIRETPFYSRLQAIFKRIEFNCGLAYGMISDPQSKELTATEVISSRQDLYDTVEDIHRSLETAVDGLLCSMDRLATMFRLAPAGKYTPVYDWGDSVLTDRDTERVIRMQEVAAGLSRPEEYRMWRYGEDEETARKNLAGMESLTEPEVG